MNNLKPTSKFLSLVLRHSPETIGITMDKNGWVSVEELIKKASNAGRIFTKEILQEVVEDNDKQRFSFNADGSKIRANQGHSVSIDLQLTPVEPPIVLYHGTVAKFMEAIRAEGLQKMSRRHLHLSKDKETANTVASRRGKPVILTVQSGEMYKDGHQFYLSDNGVWLCDKVPVEYINF
jgi:putative RNA 2'-phosphotransferase